MNKDTSPHGHRELRKGYDQLLQASPENVRSIKQDTLRIDTAHRAL